MIRLIFSGALPAAPSQPQLDAFLGDSRARNRRHGLCGAMVLMGRDFLQVIEGPDAAVEQMYDQLSQQSHRYGLVLVARQTIDAPMFGHWHLGLIQPPLPGDESAPNAQPTLIEIQNAEGKNADERYTLKVMRDFILGKWHRSQLDPNQPIVLHRQRPVL
ncbi:BLUF domain-containing protein [Paludibacterium purpuratum]|uniref:FAD-dependent sensor of blue light n=1 Tax=Paludibacterium purpuratum TaxID=1144873 RepID=A0A4R7BCW4_9NEIS|nr:BLUF domain-containing protein [Paludibacterium purpuratum]TDR82811.1 FAD-dependent sensor of blue light [Paludibacterium purpuratum]